MYMYITGTSNGYHFLLEMLKVNDEITTVHEKLLKTTSI